VTCDKCGRPTESGVILVCSKVLWHNKPSFFLEPSPAFPGASLNRGDYYPFPFQLEATLCRACSWIHVRGGDACLHEQEPGFIFPRGPIRWWHGPDPFEPSSLFLFNGKNRAGRAAEVVAGAAGLVISIVSTRVEAVRCARCGRIGFKGRESHQADGA
jgi:hypothetical protein